MPASTSELFIVDNSDCEWKVRNYLANWCLPVKDHRHRHRLL
jgi:hypothetical protein